MNKFLNLRMKQYNLIKNRKSMTDLQNKTFITTKISKVAIQKINKNELHFHAIAMSTLK